MPMHDPGIVEVLAAKVLLAWLRNRHQLIFPVALDLGRLERPQAELLVQAMAAASLADGEMDGKEQERIESTLNLIGLSDSERGSVATALAHPKRLDEILAQARDVDTAALLYAGSLMALDRRKRVNRYYLRYLEARLQLPQEVARTLEQRFRAAG